MKPFKTTLFVRDEPIESNDRTRAVIPYSKSGFHRDRHKTQITICENIRIMWRDADAKGDIVAMSRLEVIYDMAKRMDAKLKAYASAEVERKLNGK